MNDDDNGSNEVSPDIGMPIEQLGTRDWSNAPAQMPRFLNTDPELAWWNGEPGGREPDPPEG